MKKVSLIIILSFISYNMSAATCQAIKNGNWNNSSTWSCGQVPGCGDLIITPTAYTVIINSQVDYSACSIPIGIQIHGKLSFQNNNKLKLSCGSTVYLYDDGEIIPGNNGGSSNLIQICGSIVWTASNGLVEGPKVFSSPLPVELLSFDAKCNEKANLSWSTATETNNDYFILERSTDAEHWDFVTTVRGAGNSNEVLNYQYTDEGSLAGLSYYRLTQTDFDGKTETFSPISLNCTTTQTGDLNMYPNPFNSDIVIQYTNLNEGKATITVYDIMGKIDANVSIDVMTGSNDYILNLQTLADGLYNVEFVSGNTSYHQKMLKN